MPLTLDDLDRIENRFVKRPVVTSMRSFRKNASTRGKHSVRLAISIAVEISRIYHLSHTIATPKLSNTTTLVRIAAIIYHHVSSR